MSTPPAVPPRPPARGQSSVSNTEAPKVPLRPKRGVERSLSPHRDTFARSPLNDPAYLHTGPPAKDASRSSSAAAAAASDLPSRPPSVALPSLGEEGNEYASFEDLSKTISTESALSANSPQQTKSIARDLPLHAPTASISSVTAKNRIQLVTHTGSPQVETEAQAAGAGAGYGNQLSIEEGGVQNTKTGSRPGSVCNEKEEHGIPEIGVQVPMFRNAGDVQAPNPAPFVHQATPSATSHQKPGSGGGGGGGGASGHYGRHHGRTHSDRGIFHGPPGSYGMHGHGVISNDEFEQKWYEKHPEDLKREMAGEYGPHIQENRKEYHWRADNLEKLIHTKSHDIGLGTSGEAVGTPDEQIGYMASDEFASRITSPKLPSSARPASIKAGHSDSQPRDEDGERPDGDDSDGGADNGEIIHIDPPAHRSGKTHGAGYDPPTEDLGPQGGNTVDEGGWVTERGHGTPILASDELRKRGPDAEWRQPAVSPELERHDEEYTVNEDGASSYITRPRDHSRSSSRNNSIRARRVISGPYHLDGAGTSLQPHKEYEPLFPEDEEDGKKAKTSVDEPKRPSLARHHFPSQDVWEDTPGSLQLETTVETPQLPEEVEVVMGSTGAAAAAAASLSEDAKTKQQDEAHVAGADQPSFLSSSTRRTAAEDKHIGRIREEHKARPGIGQRFPSQDIWEDAPSHGHLETTVSASQTEDVQEYVEDSRATEKPMVPARPTAPTRPIKKEISPVDKRAPTVPDRPKPIVPARPGKPSTSLSEKVSTVESQSGERDVGQPRAKPPLPARPGGSKIAALQAGFLKDLNSKLGLGPQAPKMKEPKPEQREQTAPLVDARKGRAKGPQRRRPAMSPVPDEGTSPNIKLDLAPVTVIWSLDEVDVLHVSAAEMTATIHKSLSASTHQDKLQAMEGEREDVEARETELVNPLAKNSQSTSRSETILPENSLLTKASPNPESSESCMTEKEPTSVDSAEAFPKSEPGEEVEGSGVAVVLPEAPTASTEEEREEAATKGQPSTTSMPMDISSNTDRQS